MAKKRVSAEAPPDERLVRLSEAMRSFVRELVGPTATFAEFEEVYLALRTEVDAEVRRSMGTVASPAQARVEEIEREVLNLPKRKRR